MPLQVHDLCQKLLQLNNLSQGSTPSIYIMILENKSSKSIFDKEKSWESEYSHDAHFKLQNVLIFPR